MWKLWHLLFGWDYVIWSNSVADGIARVHAGFGQGPWYWRYRRIHCADRIRSAEQVIWLTCEPSKYLPE